MYFGITCTTQTNNAFSLDFSVSRGGPSFLFTPRPSSTPRRAEWLVRLILVPLLLWRQVFFKRGSLLYLMPGTEARERVEAREKELGEKLATVQAIAAAEPR